MHMVLNLVRVAAAALAWWITGSFALVGICLATLRVTPKWAAARVGGRATTKKQVKNTAKRARVYTRGEPVDKVKIVFAGVTRAPRVKRCNAVLLIHKTLQFAAVESFNNSGNVSMSPLLFEINGLQYGVVQML